MATLATAVLPRDEFVLAETLASVPDASFECEKIAETGRDTFLPLVWAGASDLDRLDAAVRDDPTTENVELLSAFDDERLYRMEWVDRVELVIRIVASRGTILDATTNDDNWLLRVLYPSSAGLNETKGYCEDHGVSLTVRSIREMTGDLSGRYGLTEEQYEALTIACERGYFEVPRKANLDDLAEEMGVSHQALSERIRRGTEALVTDALLVRH
jgi:predicted DNA binding protein